jgi:dolichol-phosphate mannosyltransferase
MKTLTLVVTYNEAENIGRLVAEILAHVPDSSVLVVDDNSPDGTSAIVEKIGQGDARVLVKCRATERGYGSAMITGLRYGIEHGFEVILTLDADFSHDPADLPRLRAGLATASVAIGSRYVDGVRVLNWDVRRLLLSLAANSYVRFLSGLPCTDCTSGFRGYRTAVFQQLDLSRIRTTGYAFLPQLLFELDTTSVAEVPICYTERRLGESKMSKRVIVEAILRPWLLFARRVGRRLTGNASRQAS